MTTKKSPTKKAKTAKSVVKETVAKVKNAVEEFIEPTPPVDVQLKPATSSQIAAYGYDPASKTLAVRFIEGGLYYYKDVPLKVYTDMDSAKSVGSFLAKNIKGKFEFEKQPEPEKITAPEVDKTLARADPEPEFKYEAVSPMYAPSMATALPPEIESAIKAGLVTESPNQITPQEAEKLAETWRTHDDIQPSGPAPEPLPIAEQAWQNIKDPSDPTFYACVRSWQDKLNAHALDALKGNASAQEGTQLQRFETEVIRLNKEKT